MHQLILLGDWAMTKAKASKNLNITRRDTLKLLGAGAAAALTPGFQVPSSVPDLKTQRADIVGSKRNSPLKLGCQAALARGGRLVSVDAAAKVPAGYLDVLKDLIAANKIRPVVDRVYPLTETADAHRYVEAGHKRGGVVIATIPHE